MEVPTVLDGNFCISVLVDYKKLIVVSSNIFRDFERRRVKRNRYFSLITKPSGVQKTFRNCIINSSDKPSFDCKNFSKP